MNKGKEDLCKSVLISSHVFLS